MKNFYSIFIAILVVGIYWLAKQANIQDYFMVALCAYGIAFIRYLLYERWEKKS